MPGTGMTGAADAAGALAVCAVTHQAAVPRLANTLASRPSRIFLRMPMSDESIANPVVAGQSTSVEIASFFKRATSAITEFFNENRSILKTLGWIFLAIIGAKFVLAALGTIDDIPLVTPLLKLVGLVSVIRFTWRYLIREQDRQELTKIIDRTKAEVLGNRQSLS